MEKTDLILCDTDVLIELIDRNNTKVFNTCLKLGFHNLAICSISFSELLAGAFNKSHKQILINELEKFILFELNPSIDRIHRELILRYSLSHHLQLADALIAATAIYYQFPLYTLNISDYRFIEGLELIK